MGEGASHVMDMGLKNEAKELSERIKPYLHIEKDQYDEVKNETQ